MHVGERELERLVDQDAGYIAKPHQAVVGEHGAQPHGASVQQRLVRLRRSQGMVSQYRTLHTLVVWRAEALERSSAYASHRIS